MPRISARNRILQFLSEQGGASNRQVQTAVELEGQKYKDSIASLESEGLLVRYQCYGGGIRLTNKGLKEAERAFPSKDGSRVEKEADLYSPFRDALIQETEENDEKALVIETHALRLRGKWSNPDLTKISVERYELQQVTKVVLTTYEVKQLGRWNVSAVFEAASQSRFAHESFVVIEIGGNHRNESMEYLEDACMRFGVGLITFEPYRKGFRHNIIIAADPKTPPEGAVEEYLEYILDKGNKRDTENYQKFRKLFGSTIPA